MNTTNLSQQGSIKPRFGSELDISVLPIGIYGEYLVMVIGIFHYFDENVL
uniref:Uncharacterized protein n=1 Tax=Rhizophagus irregularis (strain DAOM 181602 / DAOM 197198 / MUCL 43194) TaxID=747089 RepID=U9SPQ3_RHIID